MKQHFNQKQFLKIRQKNVRNLLLGIIHLIIKYLNDKFHDAKMYNYLHIKKVIDTFKKHTILINNLKVERRNTTW